MSTTRTLTIWINGKEVENNIKSIRSEMIKLTNEQAKLTLGSKEYVEKGAEINKLKGILKEHSTSVKESGSMWDKLKNGVGSAMPFLAGAFAAIKSGKAIIESADAMSDKWERTMTGLSWGLDSVMKSIATWNFSNFFTNIQNAIQAGKDYADVLDRLEDKNLSLGISEKEVSIEIEEQEKIMKDVLKSNEERLAAAKKAVDLRIDFKNKEKANADELFKAESKHLETITGLNADELKDIIGKSNEYDELIEKAQLYNASLEAVANKGLKKISMAFNNPFLANRMISEFNIGLEAAQNNIDNVDEKTKKYAGIISKLDATNAEDRKKYADAWMASLQTELSAKQENSKSQAKISQFTKDLMDGELKKKEEIKKAQDDWLKAEEALNDKIRKLQNDLETYNLSAKEKEVLQTKQKYAALYNEAKGHKEALLQLKQLEGQELSAIDIKYANEAIKESQKLADKLLKVNEDRYKNVVKANQEEGDAVRAIQLALTAEGERKKQEEIFSIEDKYAKLIELAKKYGFETTALTQQMNTEIAAVGSGGQMHPFGMNDEQWENFQNDFQNIQALAGMAGSAWQAINEMKKADDDAYIQSVEDSNNRQKDSLERKLNAGVISQTQYNRRITNLDKDLDAKKKVIEKQQAARDKKLRTFQTIVNTAAAVVGFLANPGGPWGVGLSIAAGITGAIQLAAINKATPFAKGGRIKKRTFAEMGEAGEEGVISNKTLTSPVTGPISDWLLDTQQGLNPRFPQTVSPVVPQAAVGGNQSFNGGSSSPTVVVQPADNSDILNSLKSIENFLSDPKNRQAYISNDLLKKNTDEQNFRNSLQKTKK